MQTQQTIRISNEAYFSEVRKWIDSGRSIVILAAGHSMEPFFPSHCYELKLQKGEPGKNDVVAALTTTGVYVVHRVMGIEKAEDGGDIVVLQGDGNLYCEMARAKDIIGKATHYRRRGTPGFERFDNSLRWRLYSSLWPRRKTLRRICLAVYRHLCVKKEPWRKSLLCENKNRAINETDR